MDTSQPPISRPESKRDEEQLKLLVIFHYLLAGFLLLGILFLIFHYCAMNLFFGNEELWQDVPQPPPTEFFAIFRWFYGFMGFILVSGCVMNVLSAVFMTRRVNRMFSMVVAGLNCIQVPLGTILGVFTIVVLNKSIMQSIYQDHARDVSG